MTVRRAIEDLVREGHLVRRRGSGTYVAEPKIAQRLTMTSFSKDMRRRGFRPSSETLSVRLGPAGARIGRRLEVSPTEAVLTIVRRRLADGSPMAIETLHVPHRVVPDLRGDDLVDASFYELLDRRYGVKLARGTQSIEPTVTNEEESERLEVPLHSPAFLFERTTWTSEEVAIEFVRSIYRGDRYRLVAELEPRSSIAHPTIDGSSAHVGMTLDETPV